MAKKHDISIRLFPENAGAKEGLREIAESKGVSLNHLMNTLIRNALKIRRKKESKTEPY